MCSSDLTGTIVGWGQRGPRQPDASKMIFTVPTSITMAGSVVTCVIATNDVRYSEGMELARRAASKVPEDPDSKEDCCQLFF